MQKNLHYVKDTMKDIGRIITLMVLVEEVVMDIILLVQELTMVVMDIILGNLGHKNVFVLPQTMVENLE